jgi:menaquinone-dependent protoporphyrinogen oxidase
MKVLVSAASRHGATAEIARTIGETLAEAGLEVVVLPPDAVTTLDGYDAAVLGSGIYIGHWMDTAKHLVERHAAGSALSAVAIPRAHSRTSSQGRRTRPTSPRSSGRRTPASTGSLPARWTGPCSASGKR